FDAGGRLPRPRILLRPREAARRSFFELGGIVPRRQFLIHRVISRAQPLLDCMDPLPPLHPLASPLHRLGIRGLLLSGRLLALVDPEPEADLVAQCHQDLPPALIGGYQAKGPTDLSQTVT